MCPKPEASVVMTLPPPPDPRGLNFYDGAAWTEFSFDDGLVFDRVRSITFDSAGRAWIGTELGVSHLVTPPGMGP